MARYACVWLLLLPAISGFIVPNCRLQAGYPRGMRVWIRDVPGIELFTFSGQLNSPLRGQETGGLVGNVRAPIGGVWLFKVDGLILNPGDTLYFTTFVIKDQQGYRRPNQTWDVPSRDKFVDLNSPIPTQDDAESNPTTSNMKTTPLPNSSSSNSMTTATTKGDVTNTTTQQATKSTSSNTTTEASTETFMPMESTSKSAESTTNPTELTTKLIESTTKLTESTTKLRESTTNSTESTTTPTESTTKPTESTTNAVDTTAHVETTPIPTELTQDKEESKQPTLTTPMPNESTTKTTTTFKANSLPLEKRATTTEAPEVEERLPKIDLLPPKPEEDPQSTTPSLDKPVSEFFEEPEFGSPFPPLFPGPYRPMMPIPGFEICSNPWNFMDKPNETKVQKLEKQIAKLQCEVALFQRKFSQLSGVMENELSDIKKLNYNMVSRMARLESFLRSNSPWS